MREEREEYLGQKEQQENRHGGQKTKQKSSSDA